ncbi:hypothetical protein F3Y22_tig00113124pilonHSYRG00349 [Hibiscus syriacus]|uniref:Uncharacterized protein n=1 Tax=Hibiscus syriacus TaxID=106335 RepID=A0A6A2XLM8_HIBSY|nr:hypothetical protein F3Y22_tig00113124pilonHSYRG00349 [Hibiscus syriacus]
MPDRPTVAYDQQGLVFAVAMEGGAMKLFDSRSYDKVGGDTAEVCDIKFSNDGKSMLLTTTNNNTYVLDAYGGEKTVRDGVAAHASICQRSSSTNVIETDCREHVVAELDCCVAFDVNAHSAPNMGFERLKNIKTAAFDVNAYSTANLCLDGQHGLKNMESDLIFSWVGGCGAGGCGAGNVSNPLPGHHPRRVPLYKSTPAHYPLKLYPSPLQLERMRCGIHETVPVFHPYSGWSVCDLRVRGRNLACLVLTKTGKENKRTQEFYEVVAWNSHIGAAACLKWAPRRAMFVAASTVLTFWIPNNNSKPAAETGSIDGFPKLPAAVGKMSSHFILCCQVVQPTLPTFPLPGASTTTPPSSTAATTPVEAPRRVIPAVHASHSSVSHHKFGDSPKFTPLTSLKPSLVVAIKATEPLPTKKRGKEEQRTKNHNTATKNKRKERREACRGSHDRRTSSNVTKTFENRRYFLRFAPIGSFLKERNTGTVIRTVQSTWWCKNKFFRPPDAVAGGENHGGRRLPPGDWLPSDEGS